MTTVRRETAIIALGVLLAALIVAPLALNAFLPFEDLPNHIARRYLSASSGGALDSYFTFRDSIATNAAVDLAWRFLAIPSVDVIGFSHWTMGFAMVGFMLSVAVLHRVLHGRWSAWPLVASLLVYNANLLWGFENFVVTVPFGILGFALWVGTRDAAPFLRLGSIAAVVALLYLGHVLVLLAYALLVFGYEAGRFWRQGRIDPRSVDWPGLSIVAAACLAHVLLMASEPAPGYGTTTSFGTLAERLQMLSTPFGSLWAGATLQPLVLQAPIIIVAPLLLLAVGRRMGMSVTMAPGMKAPIVVLGLATVLMPVQLSGVYFTHLRYPFILLGVVVAATDPRGAGPLLRVFMTLVLVALVAARSFVLDRAARTYSAEVAELATLAAHLPAGARVLPVMAHGTSRKTTLHFHTAAYLVPLVEAFVPTLFVGGSHALEITPQWQSLTAPQPLVAPFQLLELTADTWTEELAEPWAFVPNWQENFTHMLVIGELSAESEAELPIRRIADTQDFVLLAIQTSEQRGQSPTTPAPAQP